MKEAQFFAEVNRLEQLGVENLRADAGPTEVARFLDIDHGAVCRWDRIPLTYVSRLCKKYGAPPERYRPDLFLMPELLKRLTKSASGQ